MDLDLRLTRRTLLCTIGIGWITTRPSWPQTPEGEPTLAQLLARAGEHVRRLEREFPSVVCDEDYRQELKGRQADPVVRRYTRAEMLTLWLDDQSAWLPVRNVRQVDGDDVVGSADRLALALAGPDDQRLPRVRALLDSNARFNLGPTHRNFNYPVLVLTYLDPRLQPRFRFTLGGRARVRGADAWRVSFVEIATPTLIQGDGADRVSRGDVWIGRDGVVVRTQLQLRMPRDAATSSALIDVDYRHEAGLGLWVPVRMRETYTEMRGSATIESVTGDAGYSRFRRFETSGRVVPPPAGAGR